jgi:hypothetical protein
VGDLWPWMRLFLVAAFLAAINLCFPWLLSDQNRFLHDFLDNDVLSVLGFVAAVTLASVANIHLQLNALEAKHANGFPKTRTSLRRSAFCLIIFFGLTVVILVMKSVFSTVSYVDTFVNSAALLILYLYLEILWDITKTALAIPA